LEIFRVGHRFSRPRLLDRGGSVLRQIGSDVKHAQVPSRNI
jgi:hypothetical protein